MWSKSKREILTKYLYFHFLYHTHVHQIIRQDVQGEKNIEQVVHNTKHQQTVDW